MIVSLNWLKKYVEIDVSVDALAERIGARLVEIEKNIDLSAKYKDAIAARVVTSEKMDGSDHLSIVKLDDANKVIDVDRDESGYIQVVCGAPNVRAGITVVWLPPGAVVPETFGSSEPFVLGARKVRGTMSNGMIASSRELGFSDEHDGILELSSDVEVGSTLDELLEFDDILLDIENKSLTHRPDTFGMIGFAREVAGIYNKQFITPDWLSVAESPGNQHEESDEVSAHVTIDDSQLSARYQGVVLDNLKGSKASPLALQAWLSRVGMRPINAIVDVTNYLMLETGQPLHAFDYDKLAAVNHGLIDIHIRSGRKDETLTLLDGRTITLTSEDIVIANGDVAVALAGAMGGAATEVDENTQRIFLESATFNLFNLRATQMRHGIFSEAITRFTKGQPAELTSPVLQKAISMLGESMGAVQLGSIAEAYPGKHQIEPILITIKNVNNILGTTFSASEIVRTLQNVEFIVEPQGDALVVTPPYWRNDIHIPEDIVEEIGRLNGFDSITPTVPKRDFVAVAPTEFDQLQATVRTALTRAGANEVLTYSFIHGDTLQKATQDTANSYRIINSISPDLQYYRQTLTPSLIGLVHANIKQGFDTFALYELNKTHVKDPEEMDEESETAVKVPSEQQRLALTFASKKPLAGAPYFAAKRYLDWLASALGLEFSYTPLEPDQNREPKTPFEYRRSAMVSEKNSGELLGVIGEYKASVARAFKLPEYTAGFELFLWGLVIARRQRPRSYHPPSRYPGAERDICFQVDVATSYETLIRIVEATLRTTGIEYTVRPIDIYQRDSGGSTKNITIRLTVLSHERTLSGDDIASIISLVIDKVTSAMHATVI